MDEHLAELVVAHLADEGRRPPKEATPAMVLATDPPEAATPGGMASYSSADLSALTRVMAPFTRS